MALLLNAATPAHALGLGELRVKSGLGQPLSATVNLLGTDSNINQSCITAKIDSADGGFLAAATTSLNQVGSNKLVQIISRKGLSEPAIKITVDVACEVQLHREYMVLLDPPQFNAAEGSSPISLPSVPLSASSKEPTQDQSVVRKKNKPVISTSPKNEASFSKEFSRSAPALSTKASKKLAKEHKDVLKLSDDSIVLPQQGLHLSDSLSSAPLEQQSASNMAELRAAQAHFAALLRGDNTDVESEAQLKAREQKIQALQMEAAQLKKQSQVDKVALEDMKDSSFSRNWVIGLSAFILAGALIIGMLIVYINRLHKRAEFSWWEQNAQKNAEPKKNIEEIVNSVQASYDTNGVATYQTYEMNSKDSHLNKLEAPTDNLDTTWPIADQNTQRVSTRTPTLEESNSSTFNFFSTRGTSVKVEEISDVTQEAEFWISVNDPHRAIEILEPQADVEHPDSPVPWLYLLDLYRSVNDREKYDILRSRFILHFNANIPEFEIDPATIESRQLEDFIHLTERICSMWGGNDILPFLQSLLVDDRDGKRMGFELPVYRDILLLIAIAHELERTKALGGATGSGWISAHDASALDKNTPVDSNIPNNDTHTINFESIDFQKKT
ncbi:hypothetical protein QN372_16700 [Undibacterium sp. RTI2.1]|uniref:type IV pilus assembly protein FimV n=1 Tax=unclassified Undibacterium TaxID=2630295 RepID=UPI002AB48AF1|nr:MULTISPECIES: hypothetical protein [unclassified Undibacterium]MDY7538184.1 hypothetical protein [Undibacterium sp. 5I1]MEB0032395.1 hypothetical protein [Undibacterium sp. RTI2.1]MEB0116784.1 hypothetical protein [Undibacterium sp. RTI2.2]MEB0229587.1 hypothetical protein [Undibacterium sp. 10I3]MEB0257334.1 hypothetical protein [Undibacterium sp. 5I1]